jgi:hypothetical protein
MRFETIRTLMTVGMAAVLAVALVQTASAAQPGSSQNKSAAQPEAAAAPASSPSSPVGEKAPSKADKEKKKAGGRLPAYFADVVDEGQRKQIYSIQEEFTPRLDALRKQLEQLTTERDAKIDALLKPEQKAKIQAKREEAAAKRKKSDSK